MSAFRKSLGSGAKGQRFVGLDLTLVGPVIAWDTPAVGSVKRHSKEINHGMSLWKGFEDVLHQSLGLPGNQALALSACI